MIYVQDESSEIQFDTDYRSGVHIVSSRGRVEHVTLMIGSWRRKVRKYDYERRIGLCRQIWFWHLYERTRYPMSFKRRGTCWQVKKDMGKA